MGEAAPMRPMKSNYIGAPACFALELACQHLREAFGGFGIYQVGSSLDRPDWRDIDLRYILRDDEFDALFPGIVGCFEFDPRWLVMTTAISAWLKQQTGLPIDFQFQPQTHANSVHKGKRNAIGLRMAKADTRQRCARNPNCHYVAGHAGECFLGGSTPSPGTVDE